MEEQDEWVFYKDIDWNDVNFNRFNVDTRDFHCGYNLTKEIHKDYSTISKYDKFFFTEDELKALLDRLFEESGGVKEWRMLSLKSIDERVLNWNIKYLRIWRTEKGFVVCNSNHEAIPKHILSCEVNKEHL
jgi:hypothetical protein